MGTNKAEQAFYPDLHFALFPPSIQIPLLFRPDAHDRPVIHSFFARLDQVEQYAELVKPYILNDLKMQRVLHDRRKVYDILQVNRGPQAQSDTGTITHDIHAGHIHTGAHRHIEPPADPLLNPITPVSVSTLPSPPLSSRRTTSTCRCMPT
jgi:hypothetical protein